MGKIKIYYLLSSALFFEIIVGQNSNWYAEKPGSCPPDQPVQICSKSCYIDANCQGEGKCCPTTCGGNVCTIPVTEKPKLNEKPGSCPETPTGRWVCSATCSTDSDCFGIKKCCKNRCGALACQKPQIEVSPSTETSYEPELNVNPNNPFLFNNE